MPVKNYKPFRKIYFAVYLFTLAMVTGTAGFMIIEHYTLLEAMYMTVITLSTVGYGEVHPLGNAGRIFTMVLIVFDLGIFAYMIAFITSYFLEGEFSDEFKLYKMKKSIAGLSGHVIICGFGRNGREAARTLYEAGKDFVVIETKHHAIDDNTLQVDYYLQDDATRDEILKLAGIEKASALITTLPEDADNLFVVLTAHELNPNVKIISRASRDSSMKKLKIAGAHSVIMPDKVGGVHMANMVLNPDIRQFVDMLSNQNSDDFSIREIECSKSICLNELNGWQKTGATVLGIKTAHGDYKLNPSPDVQIIPGQSLIAMGSVNQLLLLSGLLEQQQ